MRRSVAIVFLKFIQVSHPVIMDYKSILLFLLFNLSSNAIPCNTCQMWSPSKLSGNVLSQTNISLSSTNQLPTATSSITIYSTTKTQHGVHVVYLAHHTNFCFLHTLFILLPARYLLPLLSLHYSLFQRFHSCLTVMKTVFLNTGYRLELHPQKILI